MKKSIAILLVIILIGVIVPLYYQLISADQIEETVKRVLAKEREQAQGRHDEFKKILTRRTAIIDTSEGVGTGTVISEAGHILTELHVIGSRSDPKLRIRLNDRVIEADGVTLLNFNHAADIIILKIDGPILDVAPLVDVATINNLRSGAHLWLIGNAYGCGFPYLTEAKFFRFGFDQENIPYIFTEGFNSPGTSGGGLYNEYGGYIGMYHGISAENHFSSVGHSLHGQVIRAFLEKNNIPFNTFMIY